MDKFINVPKHYAARTHEKMQEVLMDRNAVGPTIHYYMIRGDMKNGRGNNITVWEPGTVGKEYIKTYGHYHVGKLDETYKFISGQGIALLQKLTKDANGNMIADCVEEFKAVPVKAGDELFIPANCGHLVVNTGLDFLVTSDDSPVNFDEVNPASLPGHADYELVKQMRGFAYYVVENNGKPALVKNKLYKSVAKVESAGILILEE
jgi:oxalate decarboxylase/phosphoglucose isomerase-like protein (cupin superfamily)